MDWNRCEQAFMCEIIYKVAVLICPGPRHLFDVFVYAADSASHIVGFLCLFAG